MAQSSETWVAVGGRQVRLTNLEKVLYPVSGFTKAQVIDYYAKIAPVMLAHSSGRCMTLRRFPNGVDGKSFFEKRCPEHRPDWVEVAVGPGDRGGDIYYCQFEEVAALVWSANLAALELHAPMALSSDLSNPMQLVFDLDPGDKTDMVECCQVALLIREVLESIGLQSWAKTSGSKGLQLYVPLNSSHTHEQASAFALAVGQLLEKQNPKSITTNMAKKERIGKVLIDWSQNSRHKTTVCVYSLRAKTQPTCSTPVTWAEVADGAEGEPLVFETSDVLERVDLMGDLFAPVLEVVQELPNSEG